MLPFMYIYGELTENGNGKPSFVFYVWKFVFLCLQTISGIRRLLYQQTCPSVISKQCYTSQILMWDNLDIFAPIWVT